MVCGLHSEGSSCLQQWLLFLGQPSLFTIHFETLIPQPALCNARARIYGRHMRAQLCANILNLELSHDGPR